MGSIRTWRSAMKASMLFISSFSWYSASVRLLSSSWHCLSFSLMLRSDPTTTIAFSATTASLASTLAASMTEAWGDRVQRCVSIESTDRQHVHSMSTACPQHADAICLSFGNNIARIDQQKVYNGCDRHSKESGMQRGYVYGAMKPPNQDQKSKRYRTRARRLVLTLMLSFCSSSCSARAYVEKRR